MASLKTLPPWLLLLLLGVGILLNAALFNISYTILYQGSTDFVPTWYAAKFWLEEGLSPYDVRIGQASQEDIYGRPAQGEDDLFLFFYPFYVMFYFLPFGLLEYQLAAALYIFLLFWGLLLTLGLNLHLLKWLPSPGMLALLVLWTVLAYFSVRGLLLAQHAFLAYVGQMLALWALYHQRPSLAAIGLIVATVKPQMGILTVPLMLLWAWQYGQHRAVWGFLAGFGALMALSFVLQPTWFGDWLGQVATYEDSTATLATAQILAYDLFPAALARPGHYLLGLLFLAPLAPALYALLWQKTGPAQLLWVYCLAMACTLLVAPRTATTYYVALYPALYVWAALLIRAGGGRVATVAGLALIFGYWALHFATVPPRDEGGAGREAAVVYVVFPLLIWGSLLIYRQPWRELLAPLYSHKA
jgi:hypothetical protein